MAIAILGGSLLAFQQSDIKNKIQPTNIDNVKVIKTIPVPATEPIVDPNGSYLLWVEDRYINTYSDLEALKAYSLTLPKSYITLSGIAEPIFEEAKQYLVKINTGRSSQFGNIDEALTFAEKNIALEPEVYFVANSKLIWSYNDKISTDTIINVENILQLPDLPRGCEVTSLAMLLSAGGIKVDKMELADKVRKDPSKRQTINGQLFWGSPYYGFVGDPYNLKAWGYGVYNQPIYDLATEYIPNNVVNISGCDFSLIERFVSQGYPVWVVITGEFAILPESSFQKYMTTYGEINITQREHAVLVTGFDSDYVYINDPLAVMNRVIKSNFIDSFNQMGNQAISYVR